MSFTAEELQNLINLLDLAVKSGGLAAAERALPLALKAAQMQKQARAPEPVINTEEAL